MNHFAHQRVALAILFLLLCLSWAIVLPTSGVSASASPSPTPTCQGAIEIVLVFDGSGSITNANFLTLKDFGIRLAQSLVVGWQAARFAVIQVSNTAQEVLPLSDNATTIREAITSMVQLRDNTNTAAGITAAQSELVESARRGVPRLIILMTDGNPFMPDRSSNVARQEAVQAAQAARSAGTRLFTVGIVGRDGLDEAFLDSISDAYFSSSDFAGLSAVINQVIGGACAELPTPTPSRTPTATVTPSMTPSATPTDTPIETSTATFTPTFSPTPTETATATATLVPAGERASETPMLTPQPGTITGTITLPGVIVPSPQLAGEVIVILYRVASLDSYYFTPTSDEAGTYIIPNVPAGEYRVLVKHRPSATISSGMLIMPSGGNVIYSPGVMVPADADANGLIDLNDLLYMQQVYGVNADFNGDGVMDERDVALLAG
jgi:hypothetical protein